MASKCTLAARVDSFHESPRGEAGQGEINKKCYVYIFEFTFMYTFILYCKSLMCTLCLLGNNLPRFCTILPCAGIMY